MKNQKQKNNFKEGEDKTSSPSTLKRKCVACSELFERNQLIRIMCDHETKEIIINPDNKTFGRSAYLCPKSECLKITEKKNRLAKILKVNIDKNLIEKLKIMIN